MMHAYRQSDLSLSLSHTHTHTHTHILHKHVLTATDSNDKHDAHTYVATVDKSNDIQFLCIPSSTINAIRFLLTAYETCKQSATIFRLNVVQLGIHSVVLCIEI